MKRIVTLLVILCSPVALADVKLNDMDLLIRSFTRCDATFFSTIPNYKATLAKYTQIEAINQNQAYIPVADRTKSNKNYHLFKQPIKYHSLQITGYYDSILNLGKYGDYYFWGFTFNNPIQAIRTELDFLSWAEMEKNTLYTANAKIHYSEDSLETWRENSNNMIGIKTIPAQGTAEKLLLLEKSPDMTLLVCSIQGFFPPELLATIRPDLGNK